ncbi:hypothetical protein G6F57_007097 [Rhizopus arrhizus]|uniref:HSF-type DNA-binding domain-containing protein n=1 Tax=Rhizopus oryzae TaxID=64495 RepID=A0A9P6XII0_RHIOR|nr:hypothetical protein G6F30_009333 [Rhizopus arrhizus]KAG1417751.1 hypothetical protein G6F58_005369 [Rhizopus delemar]KAG0978141.1 hypothetical protein G6F29_009536 [Rhizopus arrhizus]KAG0994111.1 hypothetical protein G6F28_006045 [Rhizopus arrhizus]KAG1008216.1 hypothetical protein G6F27_006703 [Rhizopus arrhizus]
MEEQKQISITTVRTQSAFVNKLYKMLEDIHIQNLISWSERGDTFSVSNPTIFSKTVLPQYFKHNNWQSFVRQLNMYGFHKVNDMIHTNPDNQTWEFKHPNFKRGAIDDLQFIKRKINSKTSKSINTIPASDEDIYGPLYKHVLHVEDKLTQVSQSYEILKTEMDTFKSILSKQQEVMFEFTQLFTNVLQDKNLNDLKRDSILNRLQQLQSLFTNNISPVTIVDYNNTSNSNNNSRSSSSSSRSSSSSSNSCYSNSSHNSIISETNYNHNSNMSNSSHSSSNNNSSSSDNRSIIQKMGFGKESHLLNPEE